MGLSNSICIIESEYNKKHDKTLTFVVHAREIMRWSERSVERMLRVLFTLLLPALTAATSGEKAHTHTHTAVRGEGHLLRC